MNNTKLFSSSNDPENPSLSDRVKPYIPFICGGLLVGAIAGWKLSPSVTNITMLDPAEAKQWVLHGTAEQFQTLAEDPKSFLAYDLDETTEVIVRVLNPSAA